MEIAGAGAKDSTFFKLVAEAVKEGIAYVRQHQSKGRYIGRHYRWPELDWSENAMPRIHESVGMGGPLDYTSAFSGGFLQRFENAEAKFDPKEVPSFRAVLEYVKSNELLRRHFVPNGNEARNRFFEFHVFYLIENLVDRYLQIHGEKEFSEERFLPIYCPVETAHCEDKLDVEVWIPILFLKFEGERLEIGSHSSVINMDTDFQLARADKRAYGPGVHESVLPAATHALVLTGYTIPNEDWSSQNIVSRPSAYPLREVDSFFSALRIVTGADTGYAQLLLKPLGWARSYKATLPYLEGTSIRKYPTWFEDFYWLKEVRKITKPEILATGAFFDALLSAYESPQGGRLALASQRLNSCFLREEEEDAVVDATIALEALLSESTQEITYKLAMRVAALTQLGSEGPLDPIEVFRNVKRIYDYRSAVVHGDYAKTKKKREIKSDSEEKIPAIKLAVEYLRMVLKVLVDNPRFLDVQTIDEELLVGRRVLSDPIDPVSSQSNKD